MPIVVSEIFDQSIEDVWKAITNIDEMHQWYFENIPEFQPIKGFQTEFIVNSNGNIFTHLWEIKEVVPKEMISYSWKYKEHMGEGLVIFELRKLNGSTELKVTNHGLESFPQDIPEFKAESCRAGWEYFINQRLKKYLN